jgi:arylsulfatase B/arylsulfatase I/J
MSRGLRPLAVKIILAACFTAACATTPVKHIVFFLIDDYGFADASYKADLYNGTAAPPTPAIDALAGAGMKLVRCAPPATVTPARDCSHPPLPALTSAAQESYYVNKLCSPTRTALLSGRYAYTIGQDDGVIVNGQNSDLPLNLLTVADHLQAGGWKTSAYGKWDAGMTTWGSTPTCRGFDHFRGFYSASSDYFSHQVGPGYDYHNDSAVDGSVLGTYTTHAVTSAVQGWIERELAADSGAKTFAYVAHEAVHGPLQVPASYINGECRALVPADHPSRLIYCGMVRALDESVANITATYRQLGIYDDTLFILSADNGGNPGDGGSNYPLRGMKATTYEGGVRGLGFAAGAGIGAAVRGSVNRDGIMHVTDWVPTLVAGAAGLDMQAPGRPCPTCNRSVAPLDGVNQWPMLSTGAPSARTEVLLDLQATARWGAGTCEVPGAGALRAGKWKLLHGHSAVWKKPTQSADQCTLRSGTAATKTTLPITANTSTPWCPNGWTPPPRADGHYEPPRPAPNAGCTPGVLPCTMAPSNPHLVGGTFLYDVVSDPFEEHDVAAANPGVVAALLAKLQAYNLTHCGGSRCLPDLADHASERGAPTVVAGAPGNKAWLPWRGDPNPARCDTNRTASGPGPSPMPKGFHGNVDVQNFTSLAPVPALLVQGWCFDMDFTSAGEKPGTPPMTVRISVDGAVVDYVVANVTRPGLPSHTGVPNAQHGFSFSLPDAAAAKLAGAGKHSMAVDAITVQGGTPSSPTKPCNSSPICFEDGKLLEQC